MINTNMNRRGWLRTAALTSTILAMPGSKKIFAGNALKSKTLSSGGSFMEWENLAEYANPLELKARLLANENPYGPSQKTKTAIVEAVDMGNRYGHNAAEILIQKLAIKEGVPADHIMLGPGSSDLLEKVGITKFLNGGNIVAADPTYMSIIKTAASFGAEWNAVPVQSNWEHDLHGMKEAINNETKLIYICNPNNPTGTITNGDQLWKFCEEVSGKKTVFVDEAYLEFMNPSDQKSMVGLVQKGKDVIVCRTFSKVYGMAGIRVGYIVGLPSTLEKISEMVRSNMGLNITALHGALAALEDEAFVTDTIAWNAECRSYVFDELSKMGIDYLPSQTSFILFPIQMEGKPFLQKMMSHQIGVRSFEIFNQTYCRVSMGTMQEMELFTGALKQVLV